jgi:diguanylate cyclase (GGDEF)-like protein
MRHESLNVLLIEDNPGDARLIQEMLGAAGAARFRLTHVDRLAVGIDRAQSDNCDVALVDLSLPDSRGLDTVSGFRVNAPHVPLIVLTGTDDESLALQAVQVGAQDYLVKGQFDHNLLPRAVRYAIERHRLLKQVEALSLSDELTGLLNRRGFFMMASHQLDVAERTYRERALVFFDVDDMKHINDTAGHSAGDQALEDVANALKFSFRGSDILGRVGGDEFLALAIDPLRNDFEDRIVERVREHLNRINSFDSRPYELSVSIGAAWYDPSTGDSLEGLTERADAAMYRDKAAKASHPA